ncbi:hypothetical protein, partial [Paracoccus sp. S-4012]|uniref:hypothetical protein n=1 Tax=Paracoccus sp. S-4012 TaxID=2665648 RepID=UPI001E2EF4EA
VIGVSCGPWLKRRNSTSTIHLDGHLGLHRQSQRNYTTCADANFSVLADGQADQLLGGFLGRERAGGLDGLADHPVEAFHGIRNRYEVTGAQIPAVGSRWRRRL